MILSTRAIIDQVNVGEPNREKTVANALATLAVARNILAEATLAPKTTRLSSDLAMKVSPRISSARASKSMSAVRPSFETLLGNFAPAIDRVRVKLAEAKTRSDIFEVRECATAALAAAERLEDAAGPHGTVSEALSQPLADISEIVRLADAKLHADARVARDNRNLPG